MVGAMVVMLIVFALAGAVAIGATTLLAGQHDQGAVFRDDLTVQNAVSDAVAQVAGSRTGCATSSSKTLHLQLPRQDDPAHNDLSSALCLRVDDLQLGSLESDPLNWAPLGTPSSGPPCVTVQLPGNKVAIAFDLRSTAGGWAYVDKLPLTSCDPTPPASPAPACQQTFAGSTGLLQVSLSCQFATFAPPDVAYLHIRNPEAAPARVFVAHQDPTDPARGSLYLLAAGPGQGPGAEEAVVTVDAGGTTSLAYEGRLP